MPIAALALDYRDVSGRYTDAPFPQAEAAAIGMLTNLGVVSGNPDGTFTPNRTLNRAEFLKIALFSTPGLTVPMDHLSSCFPDVGNDAWFTPYICFGKVRGIVRGYLDGLFRPEREVNYVEAIKILTILYQYQLVIQAGDPWFGPYVRAAGARDVLLPEKIPPAKFLTRG